VTKKHPDVTWAHRLLASWAAMAGDMETARSAARKLLAANPEFTIRRYLAILDFRTCPSTTLAGAGAAGRRSARRLRAHTMASPMVVKSLLHRAGFPDGSAAPPSPSDAATAKIYFTAILSL